MHRKYLEKYLIYHVQNITSYFIPHQLIIKPNQPFNKSTVSESRINISISFQLHFIIKWLIFVEIISVQYLAFNMARKIKLFRYVKKLYEMLGIYPLPAKHNHQHQNPFNVKNIFSSIAMTLLFVCSFAYFLFQANSMTELGGCFYCAISILEALLYFIVTFCKIRSILKFMKKLEDFIEKSE